MKVHIGSVYVYVIHLQEVMNNLTHANTFTFSVFFADHNFSCSSTSSYFW
jgi:hypothetical protein